MYINLSYNLWLSLKDVDVFLLQKFCSDFCFKASCHIRCQLLEISPLTDVPHLSLDILPRSSKLK